MADSPVIVERDEISVMFRRTTDDQEAITRTWAEVEAAVGSLRGRKFYGAFDTMTSEYWVCVQLQERDDPVASGWRRERFQAGGMRESGSKEILPLSMG